MLCSVFQFSSEKWGGGISKRNRKRRLCCGEKKIESQKWFKILNIISGKN